VKMVSSTASDLKGWLVWLWWWTFGSVVI
jgi:hypothetical protein